MKSSDEKMIATSIYEKWNLTATRTVYMNLGLFTWFLKESEDIIYYLNNHLTDVEIGICHAGLGHSAGFARNLIDIL